MLAIRAAPDGVNGALGDDYLLSTTSMTMQETLSREP